MADTLTDGTWSSPQVDGPPRYFAPFQHVSTLYVVDQDYSSNVSGFTATALNTTFDLDATYYLVEEGQPQNIGAAARKWTRRYAKVPDSWSESAGIYAYNFIGIISFSALPEGRSRQVLEVPLRVQRDYFLVGSGGSYSTIEQLVLAQTIPQQTYYLQLYTSSYVQTLTPIGADVPTVPSAEQYLGWVASGTEITVETSSFVRWMGNIWCRETRYVKAR